MKSIISIIVFFLLIYSCQKEIDYSSDINSLRQQISSINQRLDSLTNAIKIITSQLTNIEASLKVKIDNTNNRVDSISTAFTSLKAQVNTNTNSIVNINKSLTTLANDIKDINTSLTQKNADLKSRTDTIMARVDSANKVIRGIDSLVKVGSVNNDALNEKILILNANYNDILQKYVEVLNIIKSVNSTFLLTGRIEKGPFAKGSIITFFELDSNLSQTGKSYSTTIDDNEGNYDLKATGIGGKIFRVQSDGFYFNENLNSLSSSRIVLTGITKIDSSEKVNVNVLTHIERKRIQYLMNDKRYSYDSAKRVAVKEILNAFNYSNASITRAEKLNLLRDPNDVLLNISILLQGYRTDAQLTELLTDISNDFYLDGIINDTATIKTIYNHGFIVDTTSVSNYIKNKFNYTPSSFSVIKNYLVKNSKYFDADYMPVIYPATFNGKKNILERRVSDTVEAVCDTYCGFGNGTLMFYNKGVSSFEFKITITADSISVREPVLLNGWYINPNGSIWSRNPSHPCPLDSLGNNIGPCSETLSTTTPNPEINIGFYPGKYILKFYEPSSSKTPTFVKTLIVK